MTTGTIRVTMVTGSDKNRTGTTSCDVSVRLRRAAPTSTTFMNEPAVPYSADQWARASTIGNSPLPPPPGRGDADDVSRAGAGAAASYDTVGGCRGACRFVYAVATFHFSLSFQMTVTRQAVATLCNNDVISDFIQSKYHSFADWKILFLN